MPRIIDAAQAWLDRKRAAGVERTEQKPEDISRLLLSGFDFDYDELIELKDQVKAGAFDAVIQGNTPGEVFTGFWIDGLIVGIMYQEMREREKLDAEP